MIFHWRIWNAWFGCYNNIEDIERLIEMLERIARGDYQGDYRLKPSTGEYFPANYEESLADYFLLEDSDKF